MLDHVGGEHLFEQLEVDGALDPAAPVGGFGDAVGEEGCDTVYVLRCQIRRFKFHLAHQLGPPILSLSCFGG